MGSKKAFWIFLWIVSCSWVRFWRCSRKRRLHLRKTPRHSIRLALRWSMMKGYDSHSFFLSTIESVLFEPNHFLSSNRIWWGRYNAQCLFGLKGTVFIHSLPWKSFSSGTKRYDWFVQLSSCLVGLFRSVDLLCVCVCVYVITLINHLSHHVLWLC
jgi:hypothetical protein